MVVHAEDPRSSLPPPMEEFERTPSRMHVQLEGLAEEEQGAVPEQPPALYPPPEGAMAAGALPFGCEVRLHRGLSADDIVRDRHLSMATAAGRFGAVGSQADAPSIRVMAAG